MKYKIIIFIIVFMPTFVYANEVLDIDCQSVKSEYVCEVVGNFDSYVSAIDFHYSLPKHAKLREYKVDERWIGEADDYWVSLYSDENYQGETPIITLTIDSSKQIYSDEIIIKDLLIYDENYQEHAIEIDVKEDKKDKTLTIIVIICAIIVIGIIVLTVLIKLIKKGDSK